LKTDAPFADRVLRIDSNSVNPIRFVGQHRPLRRSFPNPEANTGQD
jgi:hypothetical protein